MIGENKEREFEKILRLIGREFERVLLEEPGAFENMPPNAYLIFQLKVDLNQNGKKIGQSSRIQEFNQWVRKVTKLQLDRDHRPVIITLKLSVAAKIADSTKLGSFDLTPELIKKSPRKFELSQA